MSQLTGVEKEILLPIVVQLINKIDDIAPELKRESFADLVMLVDKLMDRIVELHKMDLSHMRRILRQAPVDVIGTPVDEPKDDKLEKVSPFKIDKDGYITNPVATEPPKDVIRPPIAEPKEVKKYGIMDLSNIKPKCLE